MSIDERAGLHTNRLADAWRHTLFSGAGDRERGTAGRDRDDRSAEE